MCDGGVGFQGREGGLLGEVRGGGLLGEVRGGGSGGGGGGRRGGSRDFLLPLLLSFFALGERAGGDGRGCLGLVAKDKGDGAVVLCRG